MRTYPVRLSPKSMGWFCAKLLAIAAPTIVVLSSVASSNNACNQ